MHFLMLVFKILFISSFFHLFSLAQQPQICVETDRLALLGFKDKIFKDTTEFLSSWTGKDCCGGGWEGVECDVSTGRVNRLVLQTPSERDTSVYMKGTLSSSLGDLVFLETLSFLYANEVLIAARVKKRCRLR